MHWARPTMARAMPARLRMPPERFTGSFWLCWPRPTTSSAAETRSLISFLSVTPASRSGKATFCSTVRRSKSAALWKSMLTRWRTGASSRSRRPFTWMPSTSTVPESGCMRPMTCFIVTVLPSPLGPMMQSVSPRQTSRSMPRSTSCQPSFLCRPRMRMKGWPVRSIMSQAV